LLYSSSWRDKAPEGKTKPKDIGHCREEASDWELVMLSKRAAAAMSCRINSRDKGSLPLAGFREKKR
jgi:hypothetical protein